MELPRALASALCAADEDYLIALCNKGTVNRAKKDLAAAPPKITGAEGEAVVVAVGDAVCTITVPLGSSTCACPSTAICRHRMSAILWLREQAARQSAPPGQAPVAPANAPPGEAAKELADLLSACPARALVRQLGERRVSALVQREAAGESADIREGGTVTVELPWIPATVRFIAPLEHSSCTCHSQSFCVHKAEALLAWQLRRGVVTADSLLAAARSDADSTSDRREICACVQQALTDWLRAGLTRLPASSQETAQRLAALCHVGGLPALERAMRRLHGELQGYFSRSAAFRAEGLLRRMSAVWRLARALEAAPEQEALALAGTFRDEYRPAGALRLYLLGLQKVDLAGGGMPARYIIFGRRKSTATTPIGTCGRNSTRTAASPASRMPFSGSCPGPCASCGTAAWTLPAPGSAERAISPPPPSAGALCCKRLRRERCSRRRRWRRTSPPCCPAAGPAWESWSGWRCCGPAGARSRNTTGWNSAFPCGCWTTRAGTYGSPSATGRESRR